LCSSLHGLALLLGELVLELLLIGGRRLVDLPELSLKVDNPLLFRRRILQKVGPALGPLCQRVSQHDQIVNNASITYDQATTTCRKTLTVSALLILTMLVRTACISFIIFEPILLQGV
jgi:hypothetical protein